MKHKNVLADMLYLDTWRGRDATGVAAIRHNADTATLKMTVPGHEFVELNKFDHHLKLNDFCWIGHNRYGTIGKNIKTNAHPFEVLDQDGGCILVGAHNGTLKNKSDLSDYNQFGTDSEALFNEIANIGLEDAIKKVQGAWALVWYDHNEEELRFLRNKERPLLYAFEEGKKTLFWASEAWMIRVATSRHGIKLEDDKVLSTDEDTLYRFPAPEKMNDVITMDKKGGLVGKAEGFFRDHWQERWTGGGTKNTNQSQSETEKTASGTQYPLISNMPSGTTRKDVGEKLLSQKDTSSSEASRKDNVRNILTAKTFKGYGGQLLTKKELDDQLENGCGWCETEFISPTDRFAWLAPSKPVCSKCLDDIHVHKEENKKLLN